MVYFKRQFIQMGDEFSLLKSCFMLLFLPLLCCPCIPQIMVLYFLSQCYDTWLQLNRANSLAVIMSVGFTVFPQTYKL